MEQDNNTQIVDFSAEISDHVIWNLRLRDLLDGKEFIPENEVISHEECTLGKWLYKEGMDKHGAIPEMQELEAVHAELHKVVKEIVRMKTDGNTYAAEQSLVKLKLLSRKVITLIMSAEDKINLTKESPRLHRP